MAPPADAEQPSPRRLLAPGIFVVALFAFLWFRVPSGEAPAPSIPVQSHSGSAFGTTYTIRWVGPVAEGVVDSAVRAVVDRVNGSMSTYLPTSELSRLNHLATTEAVTVSSDLAKVLQEAGRIHEMTAMAFDPTVGPVVDLWGFGPSEVVDPPTEAALEAARARVGWSQVELSGERLSKRVADVEIDLSAIAKGYAVDEVSAALSTAGIEHHLVEIGGEVRARGQGPKGSWTIGVERPVPGSRKEVFEVVPLDNASLATSGNYRNYVTVDGRRVTHIIDPRTGAAVDHGLGSVTVVDEDCVRADALATALYVLGADAGVAWAESKGIAALFLTAKGEGMDRRATSAYQQLLSAARAPKEGSQP